MNKLYLIKGEVDGKRIILLCSGSVSFISGTGRGVKTTNLHSVFVEKTMTKLGRLFPEIRDDSHQSK